MYKIEEDAKKKKQKQAIHNQYEKTSQHTVLLPATAYALLLFRTLPGDLGTGIWLRKSVSGFSKKSNNNKNLLLKHTHTHTHKKKSSTLCVEKKKKRKQQQQQQQ